MSARENVAEAIRYTLAIHPWGPDLPYPFSEYVERLKLEIADAAIAAYRKSTGVLSFGVQCSVCTQTANMATQPDPSGWACPRCAEVTGGFGDVDVAQAERPDQRQNRLIGNMLIAAASEAVVGTVTSGLIRSETKVDGITVAVKEFGPHDIVATVDDPVIAEWARVMCNCGDSFGSDTAEHAERMHNQHRLDALRPDLGDDDYPITKVRG